MVKILIACLLLAALQTPLHAQSFFAHDTNSTRLERVEYVLGATLAFSLFDYVGFSLARNNFNLNYGHPALLIYHIFQSSVGILVDYLLYQKFGLPSAISFDLMWWTWIDDFGFYGWANLVNPPSPWSNRTTAYIPDKLCCASWTPVGLIRQDREYIPTNTLVAQAMAGLVVSIAILW